MMTERDRRRALEECGMGWAGLRAWVGMEMTGRYWTPLETANDGGQAQAHTSAPSER